MVERHYVSKEDERIVQSILDGKVDAYSLLIDKYAETVYKYVSVMLGPGDDSIEDICQESFVAAYAGLAALQNRENFRGWLLGIASNKVKTAFRERKKERAAVSAVAEDDKIAEHELDEDLDEDRVQRLVWQALAGLPDEMREVLTLKYFQNLSYEEIAETLAVPKSTVRGRIYRAYQNLRVIFKDS